MCGQVDESRRVEFDLQPGECVFFNEGVLHSSGPNRSASPRLALALRLTTPEVRFDPAGLAEQGLDGLVKTLLVRGEDTARLNEAIRWREPASSVAH
jgi:ectoine hydroxylase-related dioxygenase (phytanoyl-CoA dioxygenase family)